MKNPAIVVVAYDRPHSLRRLIESLVRADYPCKAKLIISIDGGGDQEVATVAESVDWPAGEKEILNRTDHMGLREHVLACGELTKQYGTIIVLEDDLLVSPVFYHFAQQSVEFFRHEPEIAGIGLYSHKRNQANGLPFEPIIDDSDIIFVQYACSWGQVWTVDQWERFRRWYLNRSVRHSKRPILPNQVKNWPKTSWLKYHIEYLVDSKRYFVYPRESLTTCFQDLGQHTSSTTSAYQVPLQLEKREFRLKKLANSRCVYDAFFAISPDRLNEFVPALADYDYVVDFYNLKPRTELTAPCVLGCLSSRAPIKEFGSSLRPFELNVITGVPGTGITLSRIHDILKEWSPTHHRVRAFPGLGVRNLSRMLLTRLLERVRNTVKH